MRSDVFWQLAHVRCREMKWADWIICEPMGHLAPFHWLSHLAQILAGPNFDWLSHG